LGGIAGQVLTNNSGDNARGAIKDSYAIGVITGDKSVGGLVGNLDHPYNGSGEKVRLENSFAVVRSTSASTAAGMFGGLIGSYSGGLVSEPADAMKNCYYNKDIIPHGAVGSGKSDLTSARSNAQLHDAVTFVDYDFENVWDTLSEGEEVNNYCMPFLKSFNDVAYASVQAGTNQKVYDEKFTAPTVDTHGDIGVYDPAVPMFPYLQGEFYLNGVFLESPPVNAGTYAMEFYAPIAAYQVRVLRADSYKYVISKAPGAAPLTPELDAIEYRRIRLKKVDGYEYSFDDGATWYTHEDLSNHPFPVELPEEGKDFEFVMRSVETDNYLAGTVGGKLKINVSEWPTSGPGVPAPLVDGRKKAIVSSVIGVSVLLLLTGIALIILSNKKLKELAK
jgi:hypothetical protein